MKNKNLIPDEQRVQTEEMTQMKEVLRRMKQEKHLMAIRLRAHDKRKGMTTNHNTTE